MQEKFFKNDFLKSKLFEKNKDLINALLDDDLLYSKKEALLIIKNYLKEVMK